MFKKIGCGDVTLIHAPDNLQSANTEPVATKNDCLLKILGTDSSESENGNVKERPVSLSVKYLVAKRFNCRILLYKSREVIVEAFES